MKNRGIISSMVVASVFCILAGSTAWAQQGAPPEDLKTLKGKVDDVIRENQELTERVRELREAVTRQEQAAEEAAKEAEKAAAESRKQKELEQRVKQLESEKAAREDATRTIIRDSLSTLGSKINESVALGGTLEVLAGSAETFLGRSQSVIRLNTAELDFEIQVNDWTLGSLIIEYLDGTNVIFPTTDGFETGVDRINLDVAFFTVGDPQRFPPFLTAGRMIVPFGISTGDPVADVLTIENPLTVEAFETKEEAILIGVGFPTPTPTPVTPPVTPPRVRPLVINPYISSVYRALGYKPRPPQPPTPITPPPAPPLFNAGIYFYNGDTKVRDRRGTRLSEGFGATVGFRTKGNCGRPYDQLRGSAFCPWSIDVDIDYTNSVFDSLFLESEYRPFLRQIRHVPGMAASLKATLGPTSLIGEWNGATSDAIFADDLGNPVSIRPSAWQITLGYQFDWNPWVQAIGAQGNFIAVGYSQSRDLAGVTRVIQGVRSRVGALPKSRFVVTLGEWVLDGLKFAVEFSHNQDYSTNEGGTGRSANGLFTVLTYVW